jgi:hypothetical protein
VENGNVQFNIAKSQLGSQAIVHARNVQLPGQDNAPEAPKSISNGEWEISKMPHGRDLLNTIDRLKNTKLSGGNREKLLTKRFELEAKVREEHAFSKDNFLHFTGLLLASAEKFSDSGKKSNVTKFANNLRKLRKNAENGDVAMEPKKFVAMCKAANKSFFKACSADKISKKDVTNTHQLDTFEKCENSWKERACTVTLHGIGGSTFEATCKITPQTDKEAHDCGKFGRTSNDKKCEHLVNRWHSELKIGDKTVLSIARHACTKGNDEATKELFASSLAATPTFCDDLARGLGGKNNPFTLKLSNIQLMSPAFKKGPLAFGDKFFPFQQMDGIQKFVAEKQPVEISVENPAKKGEFTNVWVTLETPLLFNFGCNIQAFLPVLRNTVFRAGKSDARNAVSMGALFGNILTTKGEKNNGSTRLDQFCEKNADREWNDADFKELETFFGNGSIVRKYLNDGKNSARDKKIVALLSAQITDIWRGNKHRNETSNQYAIQERLVLLSYKLGYATSVNCKSGKDRTGIVCARANALAAKIEMSGQNPTVPHPYGTSLEDKINTSAMLSASGALNITRDNTGAEGIKIPEMKTIGFETNSAFGNVTLASSIHNQS